MEVSKSRTKHISKQLTQLSKRHLRTVLLKLSSVADQSPRVPKGPSISDVHTEGGGGQAQVDACERGQGGQAPCGRPHRKLKLESTDVILFSSHAKKLASFLPEFRL